MTKTSIPQEAPATQAQHENIATALAAAQSQMGRALKDSKNPHFKSSYADLSSVVGACMPALNANGIAVIQPTTDDDGGRYVETVLIHGPSGEKLMCRVPLLVNKQDMQGYGSAVTYARRYGLMAMSGVAPDDDDGNAAVAAAPKGPSAKGIKAAAAEAMSEDIKAAKTAIDKATTLDALKAAFTALPKDIRSQLSVITAKDLKKAELEIVPNADLAGDGIPTFEVDA